MIQCRTFATFQTGSYTLNNFPMSRTGGAVTRSAAVAETFEAELASLKEKGKDMKGEQKLFYTSIVERIENNVQVLADLREEHTQLRAKLGEVVKEKSTKDTRCDLEADIKHTAHEVALLKMQIDRIKRDREESYARQKQLEIALANFKRAEVTEHPEEQRIYDMKNKLDRANIKNGETTHLMKMYQKIIHLLDRQKMRWNPILQEKQAQIAQQQRDVSDLSFIARDSKYSCAVAKVEYQRTKSQVSEAAKKRKRTIQQKKKLTSTCTQQIEIESNRRPERPQQSMNSQSSVLRNKINKAAREKREEKFRQVSGLYESIRDFFGTTEPEKIESFFTERRQTTETLQKQIEDLKVACAELQRQSDKLKAQIEEAEYGSSKGVGCSRLLAEGQAILESKKSQKKIKQRELEAVAQHQKSVSSGCAHLVEVLALVQPEEETVDDRPDGMLKWVKEKIVTIREALANDDQEFLPMVNKTVFAQQTAKEESYEQEEHRKVSKGMTSLKRPAKDAKLDVQNRVLDRQTVKLLSSRALQNEQPKIRKPVVRAK